MNNEKLGKIALPKKVLFIYPVPYMTTLPPLGIASVAGALIQKNYKVKLFETALYKTDTKDEVEFRANTGISKPVSQKEKDRIFKDKTTNMLEDLRIIIDEFSPSVIGISLTEPGYVLVGEKLLKFIKALYPDKLIVAGGIFPSLCPDEVLKTRLVDIVVRGEGEEIFIDLLNRIIEGKGYTDVLGISYIDKKEEIQIKPQAPPVNLLDLPLPYMDNVPLHMFYKPMQGKIYKMLNVETARGCPYDCTYCCTPILKNIYKKKGFQFYRNIPMEKVLNDLEDNIKKHNPEFIFFSTETFLAISEKELSIFLDRYRKIGLPFWIQTRPETIDRDRVKKLLDVGLYWVTMGIEHGNENFRKKYLKRSYKNKDAVNAVKIFKDLNKGLSLNSIIGFPHEDRSLIFDTINFNKFLFNINPDIECNVCIFTPFKGSEMHDLCIKDNLVDQDVLNSGKPVAGDCNIMNYSEIWKKELDGLAKVFNLYVKLPKEIYPTIKEAEKNSNNGKIIFNKLIKNINPAKLY
jgi:anaerobic magnesium-protoporphyrin IX monomethyl ester cyclase